MRPKICLPITDITRDGITDRAREMAALPVECVEWRVDFYAGYEQELLSVAEELKQILQNKELIVTLRTEAEGGEANGGRFDYEALLLGLLQQDKVDYVDVEIMRAPESVLAFTKGKTKLIGSYHDFAKTDSCREIVAKLNRAKELGMDVGKYACMPNTKEDVETLLEATAQMKEYAPDYPIITMSMGELGKMSRLYGGLYGSEVSFGCLEHASAPGQVDYKEMSAVFDKIYHGNNHIVLIGFMGVGKSTISEELQKISGRKEIDTDALIEQREKRSIADIFATDGEEAFRQMETDLIDELATLEPAIISCGGGMALRDINRRKLQAVGEVVLLMAEPETIFQRVRYSTNRPLLNGNMNVPYISGLMEKRKPFYEKAATIRVKTDGRDIHEIAKEILEKCL